MAIYHPPTFINAYLKDNTPAYAENETIPFFPTSPTTIDDLTQTFIQNGNSTSGIFAVYDRMLRMRRSPFPHIKSEQLMYYFYAVGEEAVDRVIETAQHMQDLLDSEDESAQRVNKWVSQYVEDNPGTPIQKTTDDGQLMYEKYNDGGILKDDLTKPIMLKTAKFKGQDFLVPFFHRLRVYQLQETRDIIDFGTARTYAGNKMIVEYDWHKS